MHYLRHECHNFNFKILLDSGIYSVQVWLLYLRKYGTKNGSAMWKNKGEVNTGIGLGDAPLSFHYLLVNLRLHSTRKAVNE